MAYRDHIVCPLCGMNQMLIKKSKGLVDFTSRWNPRKSPLIQVRDYAGGRARGFPMVDQKSLKDVLNENNPDYDTMMDTMKDQLLLLVKTLYREGEISALEIRNTMR